MTKPNSLPPRRRVLPIDRFAGVAPQFERTDGGYFFRRHAHGPAIRVTAAERDGFVRAARYTLLIHAVAMALCGTASWMIVLRLMDGHNVYGRAVVIGLVVSVIGIVLYGSLRWSANAPGRALSGRPVEQPARDPNYLEHDSYRTIGCSTVFLIFVMALGTKQPGWIYLTFATVVAIGGLFVAMRKWLFDNSLTPEQRRRAAAAQQAEEAHVKQRLQTATGRNTFTRFSAVLFLIFMILLPASMLGGFYVGAAGTLSFAGTTSEQASGGVLALAIVMGFVTAGLFMWGVETLCKRLTGESAADALASIPPGW